MVELLFLLSLLTLRRIWREHTRKMSKNADKKHSLEELSTLHPCFINIFAVIYFCLLSEKTCLLYHRAFLSVNYKDQPS
jgi:capsule polysaccharide export protein KpsE/RkpR